VTAGRRLILVVGAVLLVAPACAGPEGIDGSVDPRTFPTPVSSPLSDAEEGPADLEIEPSETVERGTAGTVTRVVDGDTIDVSVDGNVLRVRLIGVDTPETVHPFEPVECYGPAASRFTSKMLQGEPVLLEFDVEREDRFGRTLAYVWLGDRLFNEVLVARGFAQVSTFPPNVKYVDEFVRAQREARRNGRGLWGDVCQEPEPEANAEGAARSGCDPSYPDVCIPAYPPDLDCGEIAFRDFRVTGSDPHGFDGDNDGIGCES
jgi:micrococcal nuclease